MIRVSELRYRYPAERFTFHLPELEIPDRQSVAIVGPSGCGKTTLLRLLCGILRPESGELRVLDTDLEGLKESDLRHFRIRRIGLVFQEFELLDYLTARDNVLLPFRLASGWEEREMLMSSVDDLMESLGIDHLRDAWPRQMSQGERQRVAICRALIPQPGLILADEPTGSLDPSNQQKSVELLLQKAAEHDAALIMVTHDHSLTSQFERVISLPDILSEAGA